MRDVQRWRRRGLLVAFAALAPAWPLLVVTAGGGAAEASTLRAPNEGTSESPDERCLEATRQSTVRRPPTATADAGEVSAWARHPGDGRLYAITAFGSLVRWNPDTGRTDSGFPDAVVPRGDYDTLVFDAAGDAYVEAANPRRVYQIDLRSSTASRPVRLRSVGWARALGDATISPCMPVADHGDAPASYDQGNPKGPPSHRAGPRLRLGGDTTLEPGAAVSVDKSGGSVLDGRGDLGDDAVGPLPAIEPYMARYTVRVPYVNRLGGPVTVAGWLDSDLSGTFDRDERHVVVQGRGDGNAELHWELPEMHPTGTGYLRLRLYAGEVDDPDPGGPANGPGEVEDHPVQVRGGPVADLSVEALPVKAAPGGNGVLALLVHNQGPYGAEVDARVTVTPPDGVRFGAPPSNCRPHRARSLVCVLPAQRLPAGGAPVAHQLPFTIAADARPETALKGGTVTVAGTRDPATGNNTARLRISTGPAVSDLSVRLVRKPSPAVPGRTARVSVDVRNAGPSDTTEEARLTLRLPENASAPERLPDGCRTAGRRGEVVECAVPSRLAAGGSKRFAFPVRLAPGLAEGARPAGGSVRVRLAGDPDRSDDTAPYELRAARPVSRLSVRTTVDQRRVAPGETFTYTVRVRNRGPSDASDVRLTQDLPAALSVVGPLRLAGCTETGHRVRCGEDRLRVGGSATYKVTARLSPVYGGDGTDLADSVTVTAATKDPSRQDNRRRHRMPAGVAPPKVDVTVRVETSGGVITPGTSDRLTVTAKNRGPSQTDGNGRHVISLPRGLTAPARLPDGCAARREGERIVCHIPRGLLPGQASTWTLPVETGPAVPDGSVFRGGTVQVFAPRDPVSKNNRTTFTIKAGPGLADLVMTKQPAERRQVGPGGVFTYELTVTNSGPSNASQVVIQDRLPAELTYVRVDDDCRARGRTLRCRPIPQLRRGEFETRYATVKLDPAYRGDGGDVSKPALASSRTPDPDTSNNRSALDASGLPGGMVVYPPADLSVELGEPRKPSDDRPDRRSAAGDVAAEAGLLPGSTAEFVLTVRNSGPFEAVRQSLVGTLPAPVRFVSSPDGCTASGHRFTCPGVESLGGGETLTRRVRLALDAVYGGDGTDLAVSVKARSYSLDPDPANNTVTWHPMRSR